MTLNDQQQQFYADLFARHGDSPLALGHNNQPTQYERFARIARLFDRTPGPFTVHEIGCGLGHFGEYLAAQGVPAVYSGSDIVGEFVAACRHKFPNSTFTVRDINAAMPADRYDFLTMSGTFNPRLATPLAEWEAFIARTLATMYAMCRRGFAVNFLTAYADKERMQSTLHYQDPCAVFDRITRAISRHVELDAGGPLYEFTLRIYRPEYIKTLYPGVEFAKYFRGK